MYNQQPPPPQYQPPPPQYIVHHEATPLHHRQIEGDMFSPHGWRDLIWAILFVIHLGLMVVYVIAGVLRDPEAAKDQILAAVIPENPDLFMKVLINCIAAAALGSVLSFLLLLFTRKFARILIYFSIVASVVMSLAMAIWVMTLGAYLYGAILLLFTFLSAMLFFWWRSRIPFATTMLETIARLLDTYSGAIWIAFLSIFLQLAWAIFWLWSLRYINVFPQSIAYLAIFLLLLSFYWTSQVIKNVVHVTVCGTIATWYFMYGVAMPANPSIGSFKRSVTTSFGSICLGSLLVAFLRAIRQLIASTRGRDNFVAAIADCIIGILDNLMTYFNHYAFTQVAIYGKSYVQSARDTWHLIKTDGVEAIINDNIIGTVLWMLTLCGSLVCGGFGAMLGYYLLPDYWITCAVLGLAVGYVIIAQTMEVVESSTAALFVCFAMDQLALARNDPILYQRMKETYSNVYHFDG